MATKKKYSRAALDKQINAIRSLCKLKPGEKSVVQELLEERRAEREKETREEIHSMRGRQKFDTGGKSFVEWMADLNREEKELEEAKFARMTLAGLFRKR